jgi:hypothetical protein
MNCIVEVPVEIELCYLIRGKRSRAYFSNEDFGQSTSTWSGHKLLALPKVCTKDSQREYNYRNHDLIVHGINHD